MRVEDRATVGAELDRWLLARLPGAEFAVQGAVEPLLVLEARGPDGGVRAAGVGTRRHGLASGAEVSVALVADDAAGLDALVPALSRWLRREQRLELVGPGEAPGRAAVALAEGLGGAAEPVMHQRLLAATAVTAPQGVPGRVRRAVREDHDLLVGWLRDFEVEAFRSGHAGTPDDERVWRERVERAGPSLRLWEVDGEPVSLANARRTTPVSSRVGPVWTPPPRRRNGYAGALVAALTQRCLEAGDERVVLLTDVANPTSNALYERIGYAPVDEHGLWAVRLS